MREDKKVFSGLDGIPRGRASDKITPGCIVLEGGAFRGVYTEGVLDALMQEDMNLECTVGVSAGALGGMNYVSGQIGRAARVNLKYRHDRNYVGSAALRRSHGVIGFDYLFNEIDETEPFDADAFYGSERRFVAVATNCKSGKAAYFEKGACSDMLQAIRASASMPYCSKMVLIDGVPYLDGSCSDSIPFDWAIRQGYRKVVVVRTRTADFRKLPCSRGMAWVTRRMYRAYPRLGYDLEHRSGHYNRQCDQLEKERRIFVISPSKDLGVSRLESDMEKMGELYYLGYHDAEGRMADLRRYLAVE